MQFSTLSALAAIVLPILVSAQLTGTVGPLTSRESKATKVCSVLDYGGVASKTSDIGPALASAFAACKTGGTVYVPPGDYGMTTWITLSGGSAWALQLDGIIYRVDGGGGNMIMIKHTTDFEMFSSTSAGAIQGNGYEYHKSSTYGPRLLRFFDATNFSIHDIALVDSPAFHFTLDTCTSGEIYNLIIRGGNEGGLDGIDVWGTNLWIHDIEVTNKDECVTVKNPSDHLLIEDIYCNSSGGCGMGSLGADTAISNIIYNNVYTYGSNQMYMIKSNGGSGTVSDCQFNNFIGRSNAYSLDINAAWTQASAGAGDGVIYENLSFNNWKGTATSGTQRGPINILCKSTAPCTNITITDFAIGTESGSTEKYVCQNAYGSGGCLKDDTDSPSAFTTTMSLSAVPTGYKASTMAQDLATPFALTASIPIPTIPTSFFPGRTPVSALMANGGGSSSSVSASHVAITTSSTAAASSSKVAVATSATSTAIAPSSKVTATSSVKASSSSSSSAVVASSKSTLLTQASSSAPATSADASSTSHAASKPTGSNGGGRGGKGNDISSTTSSVAAIATESADDECEV
ncbi:rhamnogalacturonan hydrolase [Sclerotinia borealis F-4128]|uniref:Rhamnogalacturonan hydrolase n=1 Tax=Sclerotinia borealis (strain F-4128) TaxID=1432307 RepID=W9C9A6_SCLBF|nr:rhamnogalacturonan hydrolase [Sclerotinia borealis F-4128]